MSFDLEKFLVRSATGRKDMKIKPEHYKELKDLITPILKQNPTIEQDYKNTGLTDTMFRWRLLWFSNFDTRVLYKYLNDAHIETALKSIIRNQNT